jgi:hypothetical protein
MLALVKAKYFNTFKLNRRCVMISIRVDILLDRGTIACSKMHFDLKKEECLKALCLEQV